MSRGRGRRSKFARRKSAPAHWQNYGNCKRNLAAFQGEHPLIFPSVDQQRHRRPSVADWTGIPVGRMVKNEIEQVLKLADMLERRVIGQRHALETIARRIQTNRARASTIPTGRSACSCWSAPAARARPRPR